MAEPPYPVPDRASHDVLASALASVSDQDAATPVPERIEATVMQGWDVIATRRRRVSMLWYGAIAASVLLAVFADSRVAPSNVWSTAIAPQSGMPSAAAAETLFTEMMLDEEPGSLQFVQIRLAPSALVGFGFPVAAGADDPIDVEVLLGVDGVPRAVRPVLPKEDQP
ncbi:MAG TPA: hypothetical protein VEC39_03420 [Vicinamibacterales bacterium]|nr:hypothetical protein [Vicinamibacterales bacterium]